MATENKTNAPTTSASVTAAKPKKVRKEKTPEQVAARKAKQSNIKAAKKFLRDYAKSVESKEAQDAILLLVGTGERGAAASGSGIASRLYEFFADGRKEATELEVFKAFKIGVGETRKRVRAFLKMEPAERLWVQYDEKGEKWLVLGKGAKAPAGYNGPLPADSE